MFERKSLLLMLILLMVALVLPTAVFADGGHGDEDTAAEDGHAEEAVDAHDDESGSGFALMPLVLGIIGGGVLSGGAYASDNKRSGLMLGMIGLAAATGVLHLLLSDTLMILNGLGYLALVLALFLPLPLPDNVVRLVPIVMAVYTLVTIIGYFVLHTPAQYSTLGLATKAVEVVLIILIGAYMGSQRNLSK